MPMMTAPSGDGVLAYSFASVVQRSLGVAPALWMDVLCAAAVLGMIAAVDVRTWRRRGDHLAAAAAYLVAIVLISPKSETHHLAFAIPAVAVCCACVFKEGRSAVRLRAHRSLGAGGPALLSAVALVAAPFTGAAEGPMVTAAMILLIAAVAQLPTSCIQRQA